MKALYRLCLAFAVLSLLFFAHDARAGTLAVRDEVRLFAAGDLSTVRAVVDGAPFDGRLVVTAAYPEVPELSRYVGSLVVEPRLVVVGIDPEHRHVAVHFGSGLGVPRSQWPSIERAGNDAFRQGQWAQGVSAIFRAAEVAVPSGASPEGPSPATAPATAHSPIGPGTILLVVGGIVAIAIFFARRRATGPGYSSYGGQGYGSPPYGGYPGYGGPPQGGMGPLGGGLIGAGLGGLAGYELGKAAGEREEREGDAGWGGGDQGANVGPDDNFDGGGGGSGWDDGGGGGFDGGGGDGGGGGSDF